MPGSLGIGTDTRSGRLLLALLGGLLCATVDWFDLLSPIDLSLYDLANEALPLSLNEELLIVSIDEQSLLELGQWPWARERHVELLRRLDAANVRAIALDLVFAERSQHAPEVDILLAETISTVGRVALPVFIDNNGSGQPLEVTPLENIGRAATAMGHVHVDLDNDGIARTVYLREGLGTPHWEHLAVALARAAGIDIQPLPGTRMPTSPPEKTTDTVIVRDYGNLIAFTGGAGSIPRLSYVDVMRGRVAAEQLRDKIIFVGVTAAGLAERMTTSVGSLSSVEVNANIFQALRTGHLSQRLSSSITAPAIFLYTSLALFLFSGQYAGRLLLATIGSAVAAAVISFTLFAKFRVWVSPGPALLGLLFFYPLWSWLRLRETMIFIRRQLSEIERENSRFRRREPLLPEPAGNGVIATNLYLLDQAYRNASSNRDLLNDSLEHLTVGVLLAEQDGTLIVANHLARSLLGIDSGCSTLQQAMESLRLKGRVSSAEAIDALVSASTGFDIEGTTRQGEKDLLCRGYRVELSPPVLLLTLTDITDINRLQRERGEALDFLSHDLLSPLNSVLAVIENARTARDETPDRTVLTEIEGYVRKNLGYAENYVHLSRIANTDFRDLKPRLAQAIIDNAVAQVYQIARRKNVELKSCLLLDDIWLQCNQGLLERALYNYLDNAIRYSPNGGEVTIEIEREPDTLVFCVGDQGPGVAPEEEGRIFQAFSQGKHAKHGVGLGLRFVSAVANLHGGDAWVKKREHSGACFCFSVSAELIERGA